MIMIHGDMELEMSDKEVDCCRLCSSETNLMSLFSGKSRSIRDFLRKMIEDTVHIQVEQCDSVPLICFNCSVDVSNFYCYKLNCLQNEKDLKNIQSPVHKAKRRKLQSINLKDVERPDINTTQTVMNWLRSKREGLIELLETSLEKDSQTMTTQSDAVATFPKESQTIKKMLVTSATRCYEMQPSLSQKISTDSKSSQTTDAKSLECPNCTKHKGVDVLKTKTKSRSIQTKAISSNAKSSQTHIEIVSSSSQTDNTFKPAVIKDSKESGCQTDPKNVTENISQTEKNKLSKKLSSKVCTQDTPAQTTIVNLVHKYIQCDMLNGIKNRMIQMKGGKVTKENGNNGKITDPQTFTDAILNGFDNTFVSTTTQTDVTISEWEKLNCNSYFGKRNSFLPLPHADISETVDIKLNVTIPCPQKIKKEKISPSEGLIPMAAKDIPGSNGMLSPRSSDLLQVNNSKSDSVKICKLCDKTLYNKREVMMHNKTHMQCNLCKMKFRSLKSTQAHIINCKVKQISISPFINLVRIDKLSETREEYIRALERL